MKDLSLENHSLELTGIHIASLDSRIYPLLRLIRNSSRSLVLKSAKQDSDLRLGAYIRHQVNVPEIYERGNDYNVSRIYGIDKIFPWLNELLQPYLNQAKVSKYYSGPYHHSVSWYQYNSSNPLVPTRGPHVDCPQYRAQLKYIIYLDDVCLDNGPFCHYAGTHTKQFVDVVSAHYQKTGSTDVPPELLSDHSTFGIVCSAPFGTLIVSDVGAVHHGMPQINGDRNILMGSLFPFPIKQNMGY